MPSAASAPVRPRSGFPATFWVANVMELFERAAYYGMNSVLAIYLTSSVASGGIGASVEAVGFLTGIIYAATYVLPILGGALADRYGYRRMLMVAFSFLAAGYFAAGYMSSYALVFLALAVMATGSGLFKPIISGTIARSTDETNSAFGFGIYYWMINLGAFLAPLVVSVLRGWSWRYVFVASALYTGLMLLPTVFVFRDPPGTGSTKKLKDTLMGAAEVLGDSRFMLMVVVYSGFWILYFQNFGTVLYYLRDFVDRAPVSAAMTSLFQAIGLPWTFTFDAEHVTVINAGTIILLQVVVSRIVKTRPALPTKRDFHGQHVGGAYPGRRHPGGQRKASGLAGHGHQAGRAKLGPGHVGCGRQRDRGWLQRWRRLHAAQRQWRALQFPGRPGAAQHGR
jgi:dipeptide/tripeptide permease